MGKGEEGWVLCIIATWYIPCSFSFITWGRGIFVLWHVGMDCCFSVIFSLLTQIVFHVYALVSNPAQGWYSYTCAWWGYFTVMTLVFFYIFYPMGSLCLMMYHYDLIDPLFLQKKTVCLYLLPEILGLFIKMYYLTVLKQFVLIFYLIFQSR